MLKKSKTRLACHPEYGDTPLFGVEVELEGLGLDRESRCNMTDLGVREYRDRWRAVHDGTLRNGGVEFVSLGVQTQKQIRASLHRMMRELYDRHDISESFRTSSHIHVDVRDLSTAQVMVFFLNLVNREDELFQVGGAGRERSPFCVPCNNPVGIIGSLDQINYQRGNRARLYTTRTIGQKYNSFNTTAIGRLGSIELRHFAPITKGAVFVRITNIILECYSIAKECRVSSTSRLLMSVPRKQHSLLAHSQAMDWINQNV